MNSFERVMARVAGEPVDRLPAQPLFMILAADEIGVKYSEYVRDYRVLVKGQMALLEKYPFDCVSCCSDAWREAHDCGTRLDYPDHAPPHGLGHAIEEPGDLAKLKMPDPRGGGRMTDRLEAVRLFAELVKGEVPILGWVEGPLAEAVDLHGMDNVMMATVDEPEFLEELMDWVVEMETRFALAQIEEGADIVGIGDAAASLVSPAFFDEYVAPREKKIVDAIHEAGALARLHVCGTIKGKIAGMARTGADIIDVDYPQTMAVARAEAGEKPVLAGNVHPVQIILNGTADQVREAFTACHRETGERFLLAAGCEVPPGTPAANIQAMLDYARENR